jgi:hypothetical protein
VRIVYCPDISLLQQAEDLARQAQLPIVVGENEFTKQLSFDRSLVQALSAPTYDELEAEDECVKNRAFVMTFKSSSVSDLHGIKAVFDHENGETFTDTPLLMECSFARFNTRLPIAGAWSFRIVHNNQDLANGSITVYEDGLFRYTDARHPRI